ncbi:Sulfotransferase family protein [Salegentibacter echinorum]|uniref:Sulfotransferase family protein n=1 Tax=Salegentibacter echinorum TaxID=1073325 RepID=A0A1M5FGX4_SALEC|nr:sulfotransferase [Salegentibacter echinorum]SHF90728.1 Sulfotransferase family protein [Salegentibacter echinorum]
MTAAQPLFILGNPRSGTSLFRIMLTSHELISIPPECGFIQWWHEKYKNWSLADAQSTTSIKSYLNDLATSKKIETWNLDYQSLEELIFTEKPATYSDLCLVVMKQFSLQTRNSTPRYFGDKNNYYLKHLDLLETLFPDAKYVLIIRDGRDVACSYLKIDEIKTTSLYKPQLSNDIQEIAEEWTRNNTRVLEFFENKKENSISLRFEDLLIDPEKELLKICDFLSLPFDAGMLNYAELNRNKRLEPSQLMDWKKKTLEKPDVSNISKYKDQLNSNQIKSFEEYAGKKLLKFGYELENKL